MSQRAVLKKHNRTHRIGGSDPVVPELPYAYGGHSGGVETITSGAVYLGMELALTSDRQTFAHMPVTNVKGNVNSIADGSIVVLRRGIYRIMTNVVTDASGPIGNADTIEQYVASSMPGSGSFVLQETVGSHHGWQGKRIVPGQVAALVYWNIIDLLIGGGSTFNPVALKPYFNSSDTNYALASWAMSVVRLGNPQMSVITELGLPSGVTLT